MITMADAVMLMGVALFLVCAAGGCALMAWDYFFPPAYRRATDKRRARARRRISNQSGRGILEAVALALLIIPGVAGMVCFFVYLNTFLENVLPHIK